MEKFYYIKVYEYLDSEKNNSFYGYFEKIILADIIQGKYLYDVDTLSESGKEYAKKYKSKAWAEKKIKDIYEITKDNEFLHRDNRYVYKFEIVLE